MNLKIRMICFAWYIVQKKKNIVGQFLIKSIVTPTHLSVRLLRLFLLRSMMINDQILVIAYVNEKFKRKPYLKTQQNAALFMVHDVRECNHDFRSLNLRRNRFRFSQ